MRIHEKVHVHSRELTHRPRSVAFVFKNNVVSVDVLLPCMFVHRVCMPDAEGQKRA